MDLVTPEIGMGCASLGSRVGRRKGLTALAQAYDAGVTWFDVAPSYGDAEAEIILGEFVQGKRDKVKICTKVGISPARTPVVMRAAKPVVRLIVDKVPVLRKYVIRARPAAKNLPLTADLISSSIDRSLKRLRTDHVDVLALHEAVEDEVVREDILSALEGIVRLGKAKTISIASSLDAGLLGVAHSKLYEFIQVANNPFEPSLVRAAERLPSRAITFVTHSAYGALGALDQVRQRLESNPTKLQILREAGYNGSVEESAAAFLADYALATNRAGITLFSMLKKKHLEFNLQRLQHVPPTRAMHQLSAALIAT